MKKKREQGETSRKRGQGEGSIYQRADGRWCSAINLGYENGKLLRKTYYGKTRKAVADKLTAALRDQQKGIEILTNEKQTVEQFLTSWLKDVAKQRVKPKTFKTYSDLIEQHIIPSLGKKPLTKLQPQDVQRFLNEKLESGRLSETAEDKSLSAKTVRHIHATLRAALNDAMKWALIHRNAASLVTPPQAKKTTIKPLTQKQAATLLSAVEGDRLEALFAVALSLGLRRGEVLGLRWQDVDLESKTLHVNVALQDIEGHLVLTDLKTTSSKRSLPIPETLLAKLKAHRSRQLEEKLKRGSLWQDSGLVFVARFGTPISPRNLVRKFHSVLVQAKLERISFHTLRHSCASLLLAQGVGMRTVMDILGHSQISLTMNTYAHIMPETRREALDLMDAILKKAN